MRAPRRERKPEHAVRQGESVPNAGATKLFCPHHKGAGSPNPIRVGRPDLWYQMALVDTTVEQSLVSSAEPIRVGGPDLWYQMRWWIPRSSRAWSPPLKVNEGFSLQQRMTSFLRGWDENFGLLLV